MPKHSVKRPEIEEQDEDLFDELGEPEPEVEEPLQDHFGSTVREVQVFADRLQLPIDALQRLQVAAILTLVQELRILREALGQVKAAVGATGGFDPQYFRDLIKRELGAAIEDETLRRAFRLAGDPARLERAIASTKKAMGVIEVESPVGLLIRKLQDWRSRDSKQR